MAQMVCWNCGRHVDVSLRTCLTCFAGLRPSQNGRSAPVTGDGTYLGEPPAHWDPDLAMAQQAAAREINMALAWFVGGAILAGITSAIAGPGGALLAFLTAIAYGAFRLCCGLYYEANPDALLRKLHQGN